MDHRLRFVLVLHQHQPVGNLDAVNDSVYRDAYLPLLDALVDYPAVPVNLHTSGSLVDWLAARHPEYIGRLRDLAAARRVELLGGAYHDPLLPLLSRADRRGQIDAMARRMGQLFGHIPRGMWLPERIWEPSLAADLAECGIEHTVLDDFHFHAAGLTNDELRGYYLTEAEGRLLALFAGDERLRYLIPFAHPDETIAYLRDVARANPAGTIVYADDAEKFGAWPGMRSRMQNEQWLRRFFDALTTNADWLHVTTLGECIDHVAPLGKIYVPEGSYREMGSWAAMPSVSVTPGGAGGRQASTYNAAPAPPDDTLATQAPAGTWRNFRVKYPEINEMYCRMLIVSRRCAEAQQATDLDGPLVEQARQALYRAQCGCAYWHGVFGGVYSPHLRQAVYQNLIEAETLLTAAAGRREPWLTAVIDDFNLDVHREIMLASPHLTLLVAPERGGQIYELDVVSVRTNLLATLARRREPYHATHQASATAAQARGAAGDGATALVYDSHPRKSLLDHFYDVRATLDDVAGGAAAELGDFVDGRYSARMRRVPGGVGVQLARRGAVNARPITVTKQFTVWADRATIDMRYELSGLPPGLPYHFAVEFNFAGLPPACPDRYFVDAAGRILADFGRRLDIARTDALRLVDRWLGLDVGLSTSQAGGIWAFPIQTVSRSQHGLESIQQSIAVLPHWMIVGDADGRWSVDIQLQIVTAPAAPPAGTEQARDTMIAASAPARTPTGEPLTFMLDGPHKGLAPRHVAPSRTPISPWESADH